MLRNLILLLIIATKLYAQNISVHQIQSNFYSDKKNTITKQSKSFSFEGNKKLLTKSIFGYLPWWEYIVGANQNIRYDLLTHLSIFSFEVDSLGNLKDPLNWPWIDVINAASQNNVKLILAITNFSPNEIHKILTTTEVKQKLFENLSSRIKEYNFSGVNIDFENVRDEDKNLIITNFFVELKKYLNQVKPNVELSFASPSANFGGWNFESLVQVCDYLFVMCYDYYGSWNDFTAPTAPLTGTLFNITKSFENDYGTIVKAQPEKLILGVPYYGNYWKTKSKDAYTKVDTTKTNREWVSHLTYEQIIPTYEQYEKLWDDLSKTPWIRWYDTKWNQIWYDDENSLSLKYDFAIQKKLKGIGIWALGYDGNRNELWNLIDKKFSVPSAVEIEELPSEFILYQNYPNPFNPETIISYKLSSSSFVRLKIYDMLGNEVAQLINEIQQEGIHNYTFSTLHYSLPSGVYFYKLEVQTNTYPSAKNYQVKKMILLH